MQWPEPISLIMREVLERMNVDPSDVKLLVENNFLTLPAEIRQRTDPGPWMEEPDVIVWKDCGTGYLLALSRGFSFALNGYVCLPRGSILDDLDYDEIGEKIEFTRPLSYSADCFPFGGAAVEDSTVVGFHCSEGYDFCPAYYMTEAYAGMSAEYRPTIRHYRDVAYVATECRALASQIKNLTTRYAIG
ncbi:hypothetical protein [Candidatus Macondimonas diazotrophica]|jgi:hypothetical protein|uniref:Uncharacterized protein n=1 Tax=Candidatus Macondimonas diazotrophica TaxID=2305248 RepID=A0A4Z0F804_9GAMM|nr:hypothetical protein [Candidatus Macondimonas diazotrophica]TFZ81614.1 hypothetical protein E4680_11570 [Candidatus Macondimonas diazotrophica]